MRVPTRRQAIILFSPALVLVALAVLCAVDGGWLEADEIAFFVVILVACLIAAERVRHKIRAIMFERIHKQESNGHTI